jgi:multiple sugar transport system ATP-binding protein
MGQIRLDSVTKIYPGDVKAVDQIDLEIHDGEFMVLVGPSGCGKSTLLRMIAGLEEITEGRMFIGDEDVTRLRPRDRDIAMVFQDYALYPQMTVDENVGFGLKLRHIRKPERTTRVHAVAQTLGLNTLLDRKPAFLSGGQRQRVAMGRAIAREPKAFLMDEPLSNLDAKLRVSMRAELARLHARLRVTTIYVTHDQVEAMTLGQRVAVLRDGVLQQCDTPQNLFHHPVNLFVASFIGSPSMNLVEATIMDGHVAFAGLTLPLPPRSTIGPADRKIILGIRPTDIRHSEDAPPDQPRITVRPDVIEELGGVSNLLFPLDAPRVALDGTGASEPAVDDQGTLLADDQRARFCATIDGRRQIALGDEVQVAVDHRHLQYFDRETGASIGGGPPPLESR